MSEIGILQQQRIQEPARRISRAVLYGGRGPTLDDFQA
jgi:hypothetical protein